MNKVMNLAQSKILLAILGVVVAIGGFQVWKWNTEQHQKFLASKQKDCQQALDSGYHYFDSSRSFKEFYYAKKFNKEINFQLNQPNINTLKPQSDYLILYTTPTPLIPENPRYEGQFFKGLSEKRKNIPSALLVTAIKAIPPDKALVGSACSPENFTVSLDNLYETVQRRDIDPAPYLPPFGF